MQAGLSLLVGLLTASGRPVVEVDQVGKAFRLLPVEHRDRHAP
ncbi:hypothetical protein ACFORH_10815 [Amycolatopsis roodepoortensis]|uniref:Uncharacterized protein n=1 Tax=Amycolatopsis roodepoortensis TaxID=700274 RepID=A0ABR9LAF3_9PSEU|nr:hypothetical protein [Amycolatopsis roodepoortensis]MBE1577669.1 hypothetical protein [Amycolatopsis roodepoortensis]